jgi:hypothetical protein
VFREAFERFPSEIKAIKGGIATFEPCHHHKGLCVVIEPALSRETLIECAFSRMTERWMAEVMRKCARLGQVLVEAEGPGQ